MNKALLIVLMVVSQAVFAGVSQRHYSAQMGSEEWRVSTSRLRCGLSLKLQDYGIAYFEQYATKDPHFIISNWQREKHQAKIEVWTMPPNWRRHLKPELITTTQAQFSEYLFLLHRKSTLNVLSGLMEGYMTRIKYKSDIGQTVRVDLSPINFKKSYNRYIRCVGNLLPFNYLDIQLTKLYFNPGQDELTVVDRQQLDRIRLYVSVDPTVKAVRVSGYSDNTGRRGFNNAVSEARAKAVANYLLEKGMSEEKLRVTWYGMKYPADSNDTEIGRAKNRRVVIKVVR